ncbi:MAG: hypothetical protein QW379_00350 [Thermoplasmata archaeon]
MDRRLWLKARTVILLCRVALALGAEGERAEALEALVRNYRILLGALEGKMG